MKIRYTYRIYPTKQQILHLEKVFGCCRYVYNRALSVRKEAWEERKESVSYNKTSALLTSWKRDPETVWLNEVSCVPTQQALRHLQTAFTNFFRKQNDYPVFKKKRDKQSAEYTQRAFKWNSINKCLTVSGIGKLNVKWSRDFKSYPTTVTITKSPSGKYFVSLVLDEDIKPLPKTGETIGIDLGINNLASLSDGTKIDNPKFLSVKMKKLKKQQRILSRRQKGSERWNRQRLKVARLHEAIANSRKDYLDKLTTGLVRDFDTIAIEDLAVSNMVKNRKLSRAISEIGFYSFRQMLAYKCDWYGKELVVIDRFYPSTKLCNICGFKNQSLTLADREWICPECGAEHDRDHNAAINILAAGHAVKARGENVRQSVSSDIACCSLRNVNHSESTSFS